MTNEYDEDDDDNIGGLYEDMSESEPTSPYRWRSTSVPSLVVEKTLRAVDRQWSALKSEDVHKGLLVQLKIRDFVLNNGDNLGGFGANAEYY